MLTLRLHHRSRLLAQFTVAVLAVPAFSPAARAGEAPCCSYLGGSGYEEARALAVGPDGSLYASGSSDAASSLPAADVDAVFGEGGGYDVFVARFSPDTNGHPGSDISDATYLLNHIFLGGPPPVAPYPGCGPRTLSADAESCSTPPASCAERRRPH